MDDPTDIPAARRGDPAAQRRLFDRWYPYVLTVMLHYAPTRADAEELTMDGFARLFRKLDRYDSSRPFRPWFRRLLVRVALDALRRHRTPPAVPDPAPAPPPTTNNAGLAALHRQDAIALLRRLPTRYRLVFNLFVLEEYTHAEIAEELGISVGTSKSNLAAARLHLRRLYPLHHAVATPDHPPENPLP